MKTKRIIYFALIFGLFNLNFLISQINLDSTIVVDTILTFKQVDRVVYNESRSIFHYDGPGNLIEYEVQGWDDKDLVYFNSERYTQEFDSKKQKIKFLSYNYFDKWDFKDRETYEYDSKGNLIKNVIENYINNTWQPIYSWNYLYDDKNNLIDKQQLFWSKDKWVNLNRWFYSFDLNNELTSIYFYAVNDLQKWVDTQKWDYSYTGNTSIEIYQKKFGNTYNNIEKTVKTYNSSNEIITSVLFQFEYQKGWYEFSKESYIYNSQGLKIEHISEIYNNKTQAYDSTRKIVYSYDDDGRILSEDIYGYGDNGFTKIFYTIYVYKKILTDINQCIENLEFSNKINISPNPASDYIIIQNVIPAKAGIYVEIYNIFGESVSITSSDLSPALSEGEGVKRIDISNLPAGIYFIKIGNQFEKFVKM